MNEIVLIRLREICPVEKIADMSSEEVDIAINVAFKIIGYKPINRESSTQKAWETSNAVWLCDFIYDVWRCDK